MRNVSNRKIHLTITGGLLRLCESFFCDNEPVVAASETKRPTGSNGCELGTTFGAFHRPTLGYCACNGLRLREIFAYAPTFSSQCDYDPGLVSTLGWGRAEGYEKCQREQIHFEHRRPMIEECSPSSVFKAQAGDAHSGNLAEARKLANDAHEPSDPSLSCC